MPISNILPSGSRVQGARGRRRRSIPAGSSPVSGGDAITPTALPSRCKVLHPRDLGIQCRRDCGLGVLHSAQVGQHQTNRLRPSRQSRDHSGLVKNLRPISLKGSSTRDNEQMIERARRLRKRAKRGFRGYPIATLALYGPDDTRATKLTVGIVPAEDADATDLRRWFSEGTDIRNDAGVAEEVHAFIDAAGARSIVMTDRIIGCPPQEGIDYEGPTCPGCQFWAGRDRWTGKRLY